MLEDSTSRENGLLFKTQTLSPHLSHESCAEAPLVVVAGWYPLKDPRDGVICVYWPAAAGAGAQDVS